MLRPCCAWAGQLGNVEGQQAKLRPAHTIPSYEMLLRWRILLGPFPGLSPSPAFFLTPCLADIDWSAQAVALLGHHCSVVPLPHHTPTSSRILMLNSCENGWRCGEGREPHAQIWFHCCCCCCCFVAGCHGLSHQLCYLSPLDCWRGEEVLDPQLRVSCSGHGELQSQSLTPSLCLTTWLCSSLHP